MQLLYQCFKGTCGVRNEKGMDVNGSHVERLAYPDDVRSDPVCSNDSCRIVVVSDRDGKYANYIFQLEQ